MSATQRRGEDLRRHILSSAKSVFLETGYERASMDAVAAEAGTSKRSLYAHFESKDTLFLAVLDHIRELYLGQLRSPEAYADEPLEAVTRFCGRFVQTVVWEQHVKTCRLSIAEAERLPGASNAYYDAVFATTYDRLAGYLTERFGLDAEAGAATARDLLDRAALPRHYQALLNLGGVIKDRPDVRTLAEDVDLETIRRMVRSELAPAS